MMNFHLRNWTVSGLVAVVVIGLAGCERAPAALPVQPATVTVSPPVEQDVTDYVEFTGRTAAVDSVEIRARVWGYLEKVNFQEGAMVNKGDALFEIEPKIYQTALEQAEGTVTQ